MIYEFFICLSLKSDLWFDNSFSLFLVLPQSSLYIFYKVIKLVISCDINFSRKIISRNLVYIYVVNNAHNQMKDRY